MLLSMGLFSWFHIWIVHYACVDLTLITLVISYLAMWLLESEEVLKKRNRFIQSQHWRSREDTSLSQGIHSTSSFNERRKWSSEGQCSESLWLADRPAQSRPVSSPGGSFYFLWSLRRWGENFNGTLLQNCWNCLQIPYVSLNILYKRSFTSFFMCITFMTFFLFNCSGYKL